MSQGGVPGGDAPILEFDPDRSAVYEARWTGASGRSRRIAGRVVLCFFQDVIEAAVRDYVPEARVLAAISHDWTNDPWSRGAWMSEPPLWVVDGILDLLATPHNRIIMAGADIATVYPGWITGAINSGHVAAREAEQMLGVPVG